MLMSTEISHQRGSRGWWGTGLSPGLAQVYLRSISDLPHNGYVTLGESLTSECHFPYLYNRYRNTSSQGSERATIFHKLEGLPRSPYDLTLSPASPTSQRAGKGSTLPGLHKDFQTHVTYVHTCTCMFPFWTE